MRALVTAASRHDSTSAIAEAIAAGLERRGLDAQTRPVGEVDGVDAYDAVVLGSAVYVGRWMRAALGFASTNAATLARMPVWLFSSGPLGPLDNRVPVTDPADVSELMALTCAREHHLFAGRLDHDQLNVAERAMVRAVRARYGDDRDWKAIDGFAARIASSLGADERPD